MTRGALIFAFNNEQTDYLEMAAWSAENIRRHLNIPVAVVTDRPDADSDRRFDQVIRAVPATGGTRWFEDYEATVSWHNAGRTDAYNLSPWDHTLVLDADYVVADSDLNQLWDQADFMCHRLAFDMSNGTGYLDELNCFGQHRMPMWWATVMMFRRSNTAQYIFDCMNMVRDNWQHYRDLYGIQKATYRNDFALSIAIGIVSGQTFKIEEIPWPLASVLPNTKLEKLDQDHYRLEYKNANNKPYQMSFGGYSFHAMGKKHLGDIVETDRRARLLDSSAEYQRC